ncbi:MULTISPECIES: reverse transcriptase domain-containing protein [Serratia]|uniref:reverse transcriptase domain-containing protein n=1 Tax=Serratia TaxID=613 RepID=UPI002179B698|nr:MULTISPECIES: reverse transcriptase domain-containing protein [Serratia]CAI1004545.1 Retron-type reverse transcriptase [Serratia quinivorans]CAI1090526.1 Retron-type reverse transcriptase [Serratia quinivorans]CAI2121512.1 Retron-type reverse transcriptase [Serratia quinivorans]CAI2488393.1 Retron-type reverse transcriptase [Serratia liquefaciens]
MMLNHPTPDDRAAGGAYGRMMQAWQWLCEQRRQAPDHADVWHIRWQHLNTGEGWLTALTECVLRGKYRLTPLQLHGRHEDRKAVWIAQDALVLKWTALSLQHLLPLHPACEHVKGHGGGKPSIEKLHGLLTTPADLSEKKDTRHYRWVCRTDIRGYYRNINKETLINQVRQHVQDPVLRALVDQYIHYTVEDGGTFHTPERGISRGCPLSPLMGALHLVDMDEHFSQQKNIHYARYMDDVIILARTRWSLRKHTKRLMQWFGENGFEAHPDKTQIGRTAKGFDWMGAWLTHEGVTDIAPRAKANHREKVRRLYEQLARLPKWKRKRAAPQVHARVSTYRKRWTIWAGALLGVACNASADGPLLIMQGLGGVTQTGVLGSGFITQTTITDPKGVLGGDFGGLCVSADNRQCSGSSSYTARLTPLGWGIAAELTRPGLILVIQGNANLDCPTCSDATIASLNLATGDAVSKGGVHYPACAPIEGNNSTRATFYSSTIYSSCPFKTAYTPWPAGDTRATLTLSAVITPYAASPQTAGSFTLPDLYLGVHTSTDRLTGKLNKPNALIFTGLSCAFAGPSAYEIGPVATSAVAGAPAGTVNLGAAGLAVTCTGSNAAGQAVPISYTLAPAGANMATSGTQLTNSLQPSFYMLFTNDGSQSCDVSNPKAIPLNGVTPTKIIDVNPGDPMASAPVPLGATLCTTGNTTQPPGKYDMAVTASIVSY